MTRKWRHQRQGPQEYQSVETSETRRHAAIFRSGNARRNPHAIAGTLYNSRSGGNWRDTCVFKVRASYCRNAVVHLRTTETQGFSLGIVQWRRKNDRIRTPQHQRICITNRHCEDNFQHVDGPTYLQNPWTTRRLSSKQRLTQEPSPE